jgi:hypothetical protein
VARGRFGFNPNLLFILNIFLCFLHLIISFNTNLNLTCVKKLIKNINYFFNQFSSESKVFIQGFYPFIFLFIFFIFHF